MADGRFATKLEKNASEDEEALADLEAAMEEAEARARKLSEQMTSPENTIADVARDTDSAGQAISNEEPEAPAEQS